jgi:transcriptional regulator with XRE-family HTH domain
MADAVYKTEPKSKGELALRETPGSMREVGAKLGVAHSLVSDWRHGKKVPDEDSAANIERVLKIPRAAWKHGTASVPPPPDDEHVDATASPKEAAQAYLLRIQRMRRTAEAQQSSDLHKLLDLERRAILDLARFSGELTATDENKLCETRRWKQIRTAIAETLVEWPDAARAVADRLSAIGAN